MELNNEINRYRLQIKVTKNNVPFPSGNGNGKLEKGERWKMEKCGREDGLLRAGLKIDGRRRRS